MRNELFNTVVLLLLYSLVSIKFINIRPNKNLFESPYSLSSEKKTVRPFIRLFFFFHLVSLIDAAVAPENFSSESHERRRRRSQRSKGRANKGLKLNQLFRASLYMNKFSSNARGVEDKAAKFCALNPVPLSLSLPNIPTVTQHSPRLINATRSSQKLLGKKATAAAAAAVREDDDVATC